MRRALSVGCILALLTTFGSSIALSQDPNPTNDVLPTTKAMSDAIENLLRLDFQSLHIFLRDASLLISPFVQHVAMDDAARVLKGFPKCELFSSSDMKDYSIRKNVEPLAGRHSLDIHVRLSENMLNGSHIVADCKAALVSELNSPYLEVVRSNVYPRGTVLDVLLHTDEMRRAGSVWPVLKAISTHYGYRRNWRQEHNPSGFFVNVLFVASSNEDVGSLRLCYFIPSGLDPLRSRDGQAVQGDEYKPMDVLIEDEIEQVSYIESWPGDPETYQSRRKKYLKPGD